MAQCPYTAPDVCSLTDKAFGLAASVMCSLGLMVLVTLILLWINYIKALTFYKPVLYYNNDCFRKFLRCFLPVVIYTHPEIDSRIGIENGIESTLYHMYRYRILRREPVSILKHRSRFSNDWWARNEYDIDSILWKPMLKRSWTVSIIIILLCIIINM